MNIKSKIQEECLNAIKTFKYSGAVLGTGAGKTLLGLKHMASMYTDVCLFLVVAPKLSIHDEWKQQAVDHGYDYLLPHIKFTTYLSISKQDFDFDFVYLDECHNLKLKHTTWLTYYDGPILGMTGTYPVNEHSDTYKACHTFCPIRYKYTIEDGIDEGMLNDYKIYVHLLELNSVHKNYKPKYGGLTTEAKDYQMWERRLANSKPHNIAMNRILRMKAIQSYNTKIEYTKKLLKEQTEKTLVFTDYTAQADEICEYSYHSKNKKSKNNLELFCSGQINSLSSVLQIAEGANIPGLKVGIIMHSYANEKKLAQKIGRFLRLNPDEQSIIHVLCYNNTVDLSWCKKALKSFDKNKIFKYV